MMTQQGWQPGNLLGAKDAPHAEFHTAANASHIRVMLKDDNLGLGAKIGSGVGHGECTGLDVFKNILGRLNGKDEDELVKEQKSREDLRRAIYTERKWGNQRFVSGGFLIGDKIQDLIDGEAERLRKIRDGSLSDSSMSSSSESEEEAPAPVEKTKKSKKRKAEAIEEPQVVAIKVKKSKKKRKSEASPDDAEEIAIEVKKAKKSKKERKSKETDDTSDDSEIRKRKKEKKERRKEKEAKRERKEKAKLKIDDEELSVKESKKKSKRDKKKSILDSVLESSDSSNVTTKESTPTIPITASSSGRSTPIMQGRHAVRSRNIAQKRLAHMDVAALNQASPSSQHFVSP
jgi:Pin2-interacting protein X1